MSVRKHHAALVVVGALVACSNLPPPATDAEKTAAIRVLIECQKQMARALDDGQSPAMDIAVAVSQACHSERHNAALVAAQGMAPVPRIALIERIEAHGPETAVQVVLLERRRAATSHGRSD